MSTVIIKSDKDSFERIINAGFERQGIHVIPIESIVNEKTGIAKINCIIKALCKLKKDESIEKIIVFDDTTFYVVALLFFSNSFLWLWNTLPETKGNRLKIPFCRQFGNVYSFDMNDCEKYKLYSNTQFMIDYEVKDQEEQQDIYFVGTDKGRYDILNRVYEFCERNSITTCFHMIPDVGKQYNSAVITDHFIEYTEVLKNIANSRAVLDICKPGQTGCTYRAMEALLFNKKIITNNSLYYNLDFYSPEMIFVIDEECINLEKIIGFIQKESPGYSQGIKEKYRIPYWIKRFAR